jgi:hypothetical protein
MPESSCFPMLKIFLPIMDQFPNPLRLVLFCKKSRETKGLKAAILGFGPIE